MLLSLPQMTVLQNLQEAFPLLVSSTGILGNVGSGIGAGAAGSAPGITSTIRSLDVTAGKTSTAGVVTD